jgi:type III restriction enzyme
MTKSLHQRLIEELGRQSVERSVLPESITGNLNPAFPLRPYQEDGFKLFGNYWERDFDGKPRNNHQLLFHMATGSGKTLMMAGLITYLYEQGYRRFLFFVNSLNIIDKTRINFLDKASAKYLFNQTISIGGRRLRLVEVENFQSVSEDDINIAFTTIQGLHMGLNTPRENSITYDDFERQKLVLISDEAHHINAATKKGGEANQEELFELVSWESTVERIFHSDLSNVLLEFTATVDFSDENLEAKYSPRLILDYPLREFRRDGYSKEIKVLQADLPPFERALQGVLLSQYRRKVFEKHKKHIKPVILFKSKTIKESQRFYAEFADGLRTLKPATLDAIRTGSSDTTVARIFSYLRANNVSLEDLIAELQQDFAEPRLISVNSKEESETKQIAVNSLESNEYRAVFAVDKLNEGWDVLNLFDIVRLYDTRDSKAGKTGKTTMTEAQLIGRGARYCPFQVTPLQPMFSRKYDFDLDNELRIGEELFYHSAYNPKYIQELNAALVEIGLKSREVRERTLRVKASFKATSLYKAGHIYLNERQKVDRSVITSLQSSLIEQRHKVSLRTGYTHTSVAFEPGVVDEGVERARRDYDLTAFGVATVRKAIQRLEFYEFANLKRYLPNVTSIEEFIKSARYLGRIKLEVSGLADQIGALTPEQKLDATIQILTTISQVIASEEIEHEGTKEFVPRMIKDVFTDKTLHFMIDEGGDGELGRSMNDTDDTYHLDLAKRNWYVFDDCFGTSEEKSLVTYIDKRYQELAGRYSEVFLIRNESHFQLYAFRDGRPFEPDFVLYLVGKESTNTMYYQVFIEPKGGHLLKADEWKEQFLAKIKAEFQIEQLFANRSYVVWGLPFYNSELRVPEFELAFDELVE